LFDLRSQLRNPVTLVGDGQYLQLAFDSDRDAFEARHEFGIVMAISSER
jgi:hypothetical protein